MPWKEKDSGSQACDDTECSRSEPYAHVLSKLTGRAEISELRMDFVSAQAIVHRRLLCRFSFQNGGYSMPMPQQRAARCCPPDVPLGNCKLPELSCLGWPQTKIALWFSEAD
jgi:hypothetical protein